MESESIRNSNTMCVHCSRPAYLHVVRSGQLLCPSVTNIFLPDTSTHGRAIAAFLDLLDEIGERSENAAGPLDMSTYTPRLNFALNMFSAAVREAAQRDKKSNKKAVGKGGR